MPNNRLSAEFYGKTWIFKAQAIIFGFLGGFSLIMGPLFLFGVMKPVDGRPGTTAGIALTSMSIPLTLIFLLAIFNLAARHRPLIRFYREGIEFNIIGSSSLDGVPLIPPLIRITWLIISFQGFKRQSVRTTWQELQYVHISGPLMMRGLTIIAPFFQSYDAQFGQINNYANQLAFSDVDFIESLEIVSETITTYQTSPEFRKFLPPW